jgi:tetratricopeptide (TPR) repeat protein
MTEKSLRKIFYVLAFILLVGMLVTSRDAGISGDEEVHYKQSEMVYNYFATGGKDQSSLHTPETHLQYYGQAFDNLVTILIHWLGIEDIYAFRHLMCSISAWLTIVITALFAAYLSGYLSAIFVLLFFTVSPVFMGHAQNNLKDIPFALAYISSTYFSMKLVFDGQKIKIFTILCLILSVALSIGIRAGGFLVLFYYGMFLFIRISKDFFSEKRIDMQALKKPVFLFLIISVAGYLLGLVLWPYALQNPFFNPWKSYQVMTHFPTTVRQIFEGHFEWSDFHPWYYLPKYMAITIPVVVFAGIALFFLNARKNYTAETKWQLALAGFTVLFPLAFVIFKNSNLYGSWRHFLFVYPAIILFAALGISAFFARFRQLKIRIPAIVILTALLFHPVRFMAANHPYYYLYYNQFVGGLKGAYGNYETDYYYNTMREGAEWLQEYQKNNLLEGKITVGGNFPIQWYFRKNLAANFVYFPWQRRSEYDWDYAIVANSYIPPYQLKEKVWPPKNTIHTIYADGIPVCAVVERHTKDDLAGIQAQKEGDYIKSASFFENALQFDQENELIYFKFAEGLLKTGNQEKAKEMLEKCLKINPGYEQALTLLGDLALAKNESGEAAKFYKNAIAANRKYYAAYPKLAGIYAENDPAEARRILKSCLKLNAKYKPALIALADTYRKSNPEIAKKYEQLIKNLK